MECKIAGKDCFYAIKKNDIILGFYEQTTRKRAFQGAFKLMENIVSYNEELEKGISARFPTCNIKCAPQQNEEAFQGIEALFLFVLIKFYTIEEFDWTQMRFFTSLVNQKNNYTFIQDDEEKKTTYVSDDEKRKTKYISDDEKKKTTYISDDEKEIFMDKFNVYTNSLQNKWQKFKEEGGIDTYILTYNKQVEEINPKALPNFSDVYGIRTKFNRGTRNICNYFTEYFDQNQDVIDSDISIINSMMERYVFYGLYDYIYTDKEIAEAQRNLDGWKMIKGDLLALRRKNPESMSREKLMEEVKRIKAYE